MLIGTNWILGYSHTTVSADAFIKNKHSTVESISRVLCAYLEYGVDAVLMPLCDSSGVMMRAIKNAEDMTGKPITLLVTPIINVDDSAGARKEAGQAINDCKKIGGTFCLPHHSSIEQLVYKNRQSIDRLPDYLSMIRDNGMIPGLSAHMPEMVVYSDLNGYDVETYVQIYNCMGFLMQIEVESVHNIIWNAKKPVIIIKSMAAGRASPFVGVTFAYNTIREQDMVAIGAFTEDEVHEDIEIAMAAMEKRRPVTEGRSSPNKTSIMM